MFRQISEVCLCVKYDKVVLRRHAGTNNGQKGPY